MIREGTTTSIDPNNLIYYSNSKIVMFWTRYILSRELCKISNYLLIQIFVDFATLVAKIKIRVQSEVVKPLKLDVDA